MEGDDEWQRVVAEVKATLSQLETLKNSCNTLSGGELCVCVCVCFSKVCADGGGVSLGSGEVREFADELREKTRQLQQARHLFCYLSCLQRIMELWSVCRRERRTSDSFIPHCLIPVPESKWSFRQAETFPGQ